MQKNLSLGPLLALLLVGSANAQSGDGGMLSVLNNLEKPRKILIHINNTNPILDERSIERATLDAAGIEVAFDGLEIDL